MKIFLFVILITIALFTLICFLPLRLRITCDGNVKAELAFCGIPLNFLFSKKTRKKKKAKKDTDKEENSDKDEKKKKKPLSELLGDVFRAVKAFTTRFLGHVKVRVAYIDISVGDEDPARTAIIYGATVQSVAYIVEFLKQNTHFKPKRGAHIAVSPNFVTCKSRIALDITLSVSIGGILHSALAAAYAYIFK